MIITKLHEAPEVPFKINGHILAGHPKAELIHLKLKPGELIDRHTNPFDVIFYILTGSALVDAGDVTIYAEKDTCITVDAGTERGIKNTSGQDLKLLVIKLY